MIVVDASVLAPALGADTPHGDRARQLLRAEAVVNAPSLVDVETLAVLRKHWLHGSLSDARFERAIDDLAEIPVVRHPMTMLLSRAFAMRANLTAYDAVYIALAEGLGCRLVTRDRRLARTPGVHCDFQVL